MATIEFKDNADLSIEGSFPDFEDGVCLSDFSIRAEIRKSSPTGEVVVTRTLTDGITIVSDIDRHLIIDVPRNLVEEHLKAPDIFYIDIALTDVVTDIRAVTETHTLRPTPGVTRDAP